ncbi:AAA family ATPase [Pseudonocardia acaciae]|uniref:nucleotide-binding protein n=1 Tax=Pseudonocardia acaciae TaxID=551276 RepID=UPI000AF442B0|nr:AAA family ATPase [Pseudonocardia acaciae]
MEQRERDYPPGTVGYLAQGRGWGKPPPDTTKDPATSSSEPATDTEDEARPAPPDGGEAQEDAERGPAGPDIHTDEDADDELDSRSGAGERTGERRTEPSGERAGDLTEETAGERPSEPAGDRDADNAGSGPTARAGALGEEASGESPNEQAGARGAERPEARVGDRHGERPGDRADERVGRGDERGGDRLGLNGRLRAVTDAGPSADEPVPIDTAVPEDTRVDPPAPMREPTRRRPARWVEPGALAAQQAQRARTGQLGFGLGDGPASPPAARQERRIPRSGWRRIVYVLSRGLINFGESPADLRRRHLTARVNQPLHGCYKIAMLSLKGGVGKTTVTATLGATFASLRGDRVIAVDANPDRGTLSQKIPLETSATVRHLLRDAQRVRRYTDVRAYTSQGPSRLEVLASEQDPAVSEAFSERDYRRTVTLLEHFYNIVLTDCGTGLMHSAMYGVLGLADSLVIVSSGSIDGARSASATMDWLDAHGHGELVANSVAVINCVRRSSGQVDLDRVAEHFAARCRSVVKIPFDSHLEEGAELDLDRLSTATRTALLELAATVADVFPNSHG